jgi:N-sulfoglucosamine sulfohydrolase
MTAWGQSRPNILLVMSDNQSWLHTGVGGTEQVETPGFDRVAREGALFNHAYAPSPSCTPSRSAVLTGQDIWRFEEAGRAYGVDSRLTSRRIPHCLESIGYHVGYTGKGWGPGEWREYGRERIRREDRTTRSAWMRRKA